MYQIILILFVHFIADFVLQTRKMAENKSSSNQWLLTHITVYTLPLFIFGWKFALFNGAAHFVTDYVSSRLTTHYHKKKDFHKFFIVIGADQMVHSICLICSAIYLGIV